MFIMNYRLSVDIVGERLEYQKSSTTYIALLPEMLLACYRALHIITEMVFWFLLV